MDPLIRPPSEANSFLLLTMEGCPHNKCTFCPSYRNRKFRIRPVDEVINDFNNFYSGQERVFLADGDAVRIPVKDLIMLLKVIKQKNSKRISSYITPQSALMSTDEELKYLKKNGLDLVYLGVESGSFEILNDICKGVNPKEMVEAGLKIKKAGMKLSVTIILGLGGKEKSELHTKETAKLLNEIQPDFIGALTLIVAPNTELYDKVKSGEFRELSTFEYIQELYVLINNLKLKDCIFRSNHASNYLPIGGHFPEDKESMLSKIKQVINTANPSNLRSEFFRGL